MTNADLNRIINSEEVQSKLRPKIRSVRTFKLKKNPLKNQQVMFRLNPYAKSQRRQQLLHEENVRLGKVKKTKKAKIPKSRRAKESRARYEAMMAD